MSMPIKTLTSTSNTIPSENTKRVREASFSSYLDGSEETFVLQLKGTNTQSLKSTTENSKVEDKEIDVFDAEKYFKDGLNFTPNKNLPSPQIKKDNPFEIYEIKEYNHRVSTPSVLSETSLNSRSALLNTVPRNKQPGKTKKKTTFLATIGCNCSCSDKNSVEIHDPKEKSRTIDHLVRKSQSDYECVKFDEPELRVSSSNHFSFPVFPPVQKEQQSIINRNSLEKFRSKILEPGKNALNPENISSKILEPEKNTQSLERKLTIWDSMSSRGTENEHEFPSISREMDYSSDSDSSSDLFEIESLSKNNPFLSRQTSGCRSPTTPYAPSEVSIDWSVITASAADFSAFSDSETGSDPQKSRSGSSKEMSRRRSGILSSCKNYKAVRVAGDAHRAMEKENLQRRNLRSESFTSFHEESKMVVSSDSRNRQKLFDARNLSQSGSGSSPCMLYT